MQPQNDPPRNHQRIARFGAWFKLGRKASAPDSAQSVFRQRWWRVLLLSATIQGIFLLIAWYAVQTRQHSERNTANEPLATVTAVQSASVANEVTPTISPDNPAGQATSSEQEAAPKQIAPNSTAPRSTAQHTLPSDNSGAQVVRPREKTTTPPPASSTASAPSEPLNPKISKSTSSSSNSTEQTSAVASNSAVSNPAQINNPLLSVPIAAQNLSYRVQLSDGSNTIELAPARLLSTHLGAQRYSVRLSNGTAQAGTGNFGWMNTFLMTEHGPNPLEIGGGLYLKTGESPVRLALGLGLHDGGQTWHWGKKANSSTRTHAYFLDRVSLIVYVQGALNRSPIRGATQWILPLASERAVRDVAVSASPVSAPDAAIHCQPCVQAQVRAHLGEMNYWSVWYDGAHNWRPVMMRMRLAHPRGQTLTLTLQ
jgi:hypothetical protein